LRMMKCAALLLLPLLVQCLTLENRQGLAIIGGFGPIESEGDYKLGYSDEIQVFSPNNACNGNSITNMPQAITDSVTGILDIEGVPSLTVCGGIIHKDMERIFSKECWQYLNKKWIDLPEMMIKVSDAAYAVSDNELYVIGGMNDVNDKPYFDPVYLKDVQIFDGTSKTWRLGANLPSERKGSCAVEIDGNIVVIGGDSETFGDGSVERGVLLLKNNEWHSLKPLSQSRIDAGCSVVTLNGQRGILVLGGSTTLFRDNAEFLPWDSQDPNSQSWKLFYWTHSRREHNPAVAQINGDIFIAGGSYTSGLIEVLNEDNRWEIYEKSLDDARNSISSVLIPCEILE